MAVPTSPENLPAGRGSGGARSAGERQSPGRGAQVAAGARGAPGRDRRCQAVPELFSPLESGRGR